MTAGIDSSGTDLPAAVRDAARLREPDRYLAALLAPKSVRSDLMAIAAFSSELLRVRDVVREPMMGEIRLQWWRDALQTLWRGELTANPVADMLGAAMRRHELAPGALDVLIEARLRELQADAGDNAAGEDTAIEAEAFLFKAALIVLGVPAASARDAACAHAGVAYGVARGLAMASMRHGQRAPPTRGAHGGRTPGGSRAREALAAARERIPDLGPRALAAFLPLVMVEPYLRAQERRDANQISYFAPVTPLRRIWRIWRAKRLARI